MRVRVYFCKEPDVEIIIKGNKIGRQGNKARTNDVDEFKIELTGKPLDHKEDQMTWTKVGELILTPTPSVKIKGFTVRKLLKLKHMKDDLHTRSE